MPSTTGWLRSMSRAIVVPPFILSSLRASGRDHAHRGRRRLQDTCTAVADAVAGGSLAPTRPCATHCSYAEARGSLRREEPPAGVPLESGRQSLLPARWLTVGLSQWRRRAARTFGFCRSPSLAMSQLGARLSAP